MLLLKRQRRLRSNKWSINLFRENNISASDFILPIFITDGKNQKQEIKSMPNVYRYSPDNLKQANRQCNKKWDTGNNLISSNSSR